MGIDWQDALMNAVAVLIITCPCALALAVPVVQVIASGRLMRQGVLLKSATALERLAVVDWVVLDKTGTVTIGKPVLIEDGNWSQDDLVLAAGIASASKHPLAKALVAACPGAKLIEGVTEVAGSGLIAGEYNLGSRSHVGVSSDIGQDSPGLELWLARSGKDPIQFRFDDRLRSDAVQAIAKLKAYKIPVELLSGDREQTVAQVARLAGVETWRSATNPAMKVERLRELAAQGKRVMMVGDGLNDAPALAAAYVSISPSTAVDVTRTAADVVFQGERLDPVVEALTVARQSRVLVLQNFLLAIGYNLFTVPLAIAGKVTPLIAAIAMSSSSLVVIANALRLTRRRKS
jgi:Cu2+-exporting ATPase